MAWLGKVFNGPMVHCTHCSAKWAVTNNAGRGFCLTCQWPTCGRLGCANCPHEARRG